jgi:hypothetical protein
MIGSNLQSLMENDVSQQKIFTIATENDFGAPTSKLDE